MRLEAKNLRKFWVRETPAGLVNGVNTTYTLTYPPFDGVEIEVFLNGLVQSYTVDYTVAGSTITMTAAPVVGQQIRVKYARLEGGA